MPGLPQNRSPFFSKAYGGFSPRQQQYYLTQIENPCDKVILDPMAGNGFALAHLAFDGANVWLGDLNPALVSLALLRDPRIIRQYAALEPYVVKLIRGFEKRKSKTEQLKYVEEWIAPTIREQLHSYVRKLGLGRLSSPFSYSEEFWKAPAQIRVAASLPILAARDITCYRVSDNRTWLKRGGICREPNLHEPLMRAWERWRLFAERVCNSTAGSDSKWGEVSARLMNVELGYFSDSPLADVIITSPPYANRLDYTSMWAPELEVLSEMWGEDSKRIKLNQIGTTVIKGKTTGSVNGQEQSSIVKLPQSILESLAAIRDDKAEASARYYYPFFRNYALALQRGLTELGMRLNSGGLLVMFVRDTVRKDVMFATSELVKDVLTNSCNMQEVDRVRLIHRSHLGLLRRGSAVGLYGLAQQEWWLTFRKE